jgi:hypothetical protein
MPVSRARLTQLRKIWQRVVRSLIRQVQLRWNWHRLGVALRPQAELFTHLIRRGSRLEYTPGVRQEARVAAARVRAAREAATAANGDDTDAPADETTDR